MSSHCIEITDANFEAEVAKSPLPVLIDFWAVWCGPCRAVAPHFESLAQDYAGRVRFGKCDVDANQEIAARYDVRGVPMFLAFSRGKVVARRRARRRAQSWKSWRRRRWPRRRLPQDNRLEQHDHDAGDRSAGDDAGGHRLLIVDEDPVMSESARRVRRPASQKMPAPIAIASTSLKRNTKPSPSATPDRGSGRASAGSRSRRPDPARRRSPSRCARSDATC